MAGASCSEVQGRRKVQEGNRLFRDGHYKESVAAFEEAEKFVPNLPELWLNKGHTCRQILVPGAKTPESTEAAKCAIEAFDKYQKLKPSDPRGESYYIQTLFDSDQYEELAKMFEARYQKNPKDLESVNGLIQVYSKWNKLDESLEWYARKAEIRSNDPEAQYAVGVFIYNQLFQKGGSPEKSTHDPRPDPNKPRQVKMHPAFGVGDIVSQQRVDLADKGIQFLDKAIALRPKYHEAMTYANLLQRQKSYAFFEYPDEWQKCINQALVYQKMSLEVQGKPVPENVLKQLEAVAKAEGDKKVVSKADKKKVRGKKGRAVKRGKRS
jgi:tetratricopeptide (TPR) repeat protein